MTAADVTMPAWLRRIIVCPVCHAELVDATGPDGAPELICAHDCDSPGTRRAYPIQGGTPVLLKDEARIVTG